jgi:hypothetical protein
MAYVVPRRNGRFEVRESVHTPRGPRARSLAGFHALTEDVLSVAAKRASRSFDATAVIASAQRAGAPVHTPLPGETAPDDATRRFVEASRRMSRSMGRKRSALKPADPGIALIDLLGFADAVRQSQPLRPHEPLAFPVLTRLAQDHQVATAH